MDKASEIQPVFGPDQQISTGAEQANPRVGRPGRTSYDVVVIGGGPAGTTASSLIAKEGRSVLLLEREVFPRFKIGESLIPATASTLARLGLLDKLEASHFTRKYSVQFFTADGRSSRPFYFGETENEAWRQTWQVLRSEFDQLLFDNAREHGVEAWQGVAVKEVLFEGDRAVGVRLSLPDGEELDVASRVVVDASGQRSLLQRHFKLSQKDPNLRQATVFSHFENAHRDEGIDEGATLVLQTRDKGSWFWYIPLPNNRVSIGVVGPVEYLITGRGGDPQQIFDEEVAKCAPLQERMKNSKQVEPIRVLNEFSYMTSTPSGDGWVLAGDAFGFLDPMYSTGVLLAFASGEMAADATLAALEADDPSAERLGVFAPRLVRGMSAFRRLVYSFYQKEFSFSRFLRAYPHHRLAVIDILCGNVFEKDFEQLFADIGTIIELPHEGRQVLVGQKPIDHRERAAVGAAEAG